MSNIRSCGSLSSGNDKLLRVKAEQLSKDERMKEIAAKRQAMEQELANLEKESMAVDQEEDETQPATEEELKASKRSPPGSTKTTPVKSLSAPKRHRSEGGLAEKPSPAMEVGPSGDGGSGATSQEPTVKSLQNQLDDAMKLIENLKIAQMKATPAPSSAARGKPGTPSSAAGTPSSAAKTTPGASAKKTPASASATPQSSLSKSSVESPGSKAAEEDLEEKENKEALARYKMVDARLRRLCEKKPSGKVQVPDSIHQQWLQVGKPRDELRQLLELYEFDKDKFIHRVTKMIELRKEDAQEVLKGWFTVDMMKTELKWSSSYIKDVVTYCKKHGLVKNDKYSTKIFKYFVGYSDKESTKRVKTETEQQSSTGEANAGVELSGDWLQPTLEQDAEGGDGGNVLSPEQEELETEQKFTDGMLTKMSKITDLISKLDSFSAGEDSARVKKSVEALETKLAAAQGAYDSFVAAKTALETMTRTKENTVDLKKHMRDAMQKAAALSSIEVQAKALEKSLKKKKKDAAETE